MAARKVLILGGGMAGLSTAYELTRPERAGQFEVTVIQQGWRLGGKGASARNLARRNRIEEHGLHLWMGCYENAFRLMRGCYEELGRTPGEPLATWRDAFMPRDTTVLMEHHDGGWHPWVQKFPVFDNEPGSSDDVAGPLELTLGLLRWMMSSISGAGASRFTPPKSACTGTQETSGSKILGRVIDSLVSVLEHGEAETLQPSFRAAVRLLRVFRTGMAAVLRRRLSDPEQRRLYLTIDFMVANTIGILQDDLLIAPDGTMATYPQWLDNLQRIEHLDYREWLGKHGCRTETLRSAIVRGLGDAVFNTGHDGAAGTALNGLVRLNLTFRGSVFWEMRAGMGETVFTPFYQVLKNRGVKFEFFSRVKNIKLDASKSFVESVQVARQADLLSGEYQPLIDVPHGSPPDVGVQPTLACWPTEPLWDQLVNGNALKGIDFESPAGGAHEQDETLSGFDEVVVAIPVGALRPIASELAEYNPRFDDMLRSLRTTRTQAMQLWFDRPAEDLGFKGDPAVLTGYADPFDTWSDMTHLGLVEDWGQAIAQCSYLCGSLDDDDVPGQTPLERTREIGKAWIESNMQDILPHFSQPSGVQWRMLEDPDDNTGDARLDAQYLRANTHPSERYVLSVPGSSRFRLRAHESSYDNVTLAGDWVKTGMNVGSIEAAAMAGLGAARAITEDEVLIVGDFED